MLPIQSWNGLGWKGPQSPSSSNLLPWARTPSSYLGFKIKCKQSPCFQFTAWKISKSRTPRSETHSHNPEFRTMLSESLLETKTQFCYLNIILTSPLTPNKFCMCTNLKEATNSWQMSSFAEECTAAQRNEMLCLKNTKNKTDLCPTINSSLIKR